MPRIQQPRQPGPPPRPRSDLDDVDASLLVLLSREGRRSVAALARDLGVPESTCAGRIRALVDRGIIRGFHAELAPASLGYTVEAMIAVRFSGHMRKHIEAFRDDVAQVPGVIAIYNTSGANDFLVHVAAAGSDALRDLVLDRVTSRAGVVHAETSLIFEATRGVGVCSGPVGL